jgi:signal transduction histidine kinase
LAARRHERRSGCPVNCRIGTLPEKVPFSLKTCLYRVAQEGLTNAFRHANGVGQILQARYEQGRIEISILDGGRGSTRPRPSTRTPDKGLWACAIASSPWAGSFMSPRAPKAVPA